MLWVSTHSRLNFPLPFSSLSWEKIFPGEGCHTCWYCIPWPQKLSDSTRDKSLYCPPFAETDDWFQSLLSIHPIWPTHSPVAGCLAAHQKQPALERQLTYGTERKLPMFNGEFCCSLDLNLSLLRQFLILQGLTLGCLPRSLWPRENPDTNNYSWEKTFDHVIHWDS